MGQKTPDTERAIEIMKPVMDFLHIEVDADNNYLFLNGQAINITFNSTQATVYEFIGFLVDVYCDHRGITYNGLQDRIHRTWHNEAQIREVRKMFGTEEGETE